MFAATLARDVFQLQPRPNLAQRENAVQDPLYKFIPDVLSCIFEYLSGDDLLALITASPAAQLATDRNDFWKRKISDIPWLWDFKDHLEAADPERTDYKRVYVWLNAVTTPRFGMNTPFMHLANRRRIWTPCEQIKEHYMTRLQFMPQKAPDAAIVERSQCTRMPFVALPRGDEGPAIETKFLLHSFMELDHASTVFETFWNASGALVGLGMVLGETRRILGIDNSRSATVTRIAVPIRRGDWIRELELASVEVPEGNHAIGAVVGINVSVAPP